MRALVLIVICIFLLVALQASYLVIEARHPGKTQTRATEGHEGEEHYNITPDLSQDAGKESVEPENHADAIVQSLPVTPQGSVLKDTLARDIPIINVTIKHRDLNNIDENKDIHDQMLGDAPMKEPSGHNHRKSMKKRNRTKHHKGDHGKGKNNNGHLSLSSQTCAHDGDCNQGECCVITRKGQHVCKPGAFKTIGRRCLSSCVCKDDLRCFINNSHKSHKKSPYKHWPFGHCADPSNAKIQDGYSLFEADKTSTISTTTGN